MTSFSAFLTRSLDVLRAECPDAYDAVCARLGDRTVSISVDGEEVAVSSLRGTLRIRGSVPRVAATAISSRTTLLQLLDGQRGLTDAIVSDDVRLVGPLEDLVAFYEGLLQYFVGAVRCPSFASLLDDFISDCDGPRVSLAAATAAMGTRDGC